MQAIPGTIFTKTRFGVRQGSEITPEDIRGAISTLSFSKKVVVDIDAPGLGPAALLTWAFEELAEAESNVSVACRKAFTAAVLSKTAVECLLDWYLSTTHIGASVRVHAGTEEKLKALDAERSLNVGRSLFRQILFEPRNRAIHDYRTVDLEAARRACELANLFIGGSIAARNPRHCAVYYGPLDFATGESAKQRIGLSPEISCDAYVYFGGLGAPGEHGVLLPRGDDPVIVLLESLGDGDVDARYARLRKFDPCLLREVLSMLEKHSPAAYELAKHERDFLLDKFGIEMSNDVDE